MSVVTADWIAIDWGTSSLRVWAMSSDDRVLARAQSDNGMGRLTSDGYEPALLDLIDGWLDPKRTTLCLACGMVGARQGWVEAPYRPVPCAASVSDDLTKAPIHSPLLDVRICPGVQQDVPPDVMRGEETQLAGFLARHPAFEGLVCLPGTHSKWASLMGGKITGFRTFLTGELFALLADQSVLRHSIGEGWDAPAFASAVVEAHSDPAGVSAQLFAIRAASLIRDLAPEAARARLSGLLIGVELAAMTSQITGPVAIIGADGLAGRYRDALAHLGHEAIVVDTSGITLDGLIAARHAFERTQP